MDTEFVDLDSFLPTADHVLEIIYPNMKPSGWKITLAAASHEKNVAFRENEAHAAIERDKVIREAQFNGRRYEGEDGKTPEQHRRENVAWIVARIVGWTPVKIGGIEYAFSDKNAEDLLIRPELAFALTQISKALGDDARFMPGFAKA